AVHASRCIGEDAIVEQALQQPLAARGVVACDDADQREQPLFDRSHDVSIDTHAGFEHALNQRDHVRARVPAAAPPAGTPVVKALCKPYTLCPFFVPVLSSWSRYVVVASA